MNVSEIKEKLFQNLDKKYGDFNASLTPNISRERIIGVRVPILRNIAKEIKSEADKHAFFNSLPHYYLEENMLHAILLGTIRDIDKAYFELERFLPFVDNWAVSDCISINAIYRDEEKLFLYVKKWISSGEEYHVRVAIRQLMKLKKTAYCDAHLQTVAAITDERYYVKMMVAWYFATALCFNYDPVVEILKSHVLDPWTHNKTIRKAIESYRITDEQKQFLRGLSVKG